MKYYLNISVGVFSLIFGASPLIASNISFLNDVLPDNSRKPLEISISQAKFDESLDVLNYIGKLSGSTPKEAVIDEISISYKFSNGLKFTFEKNTSSAEISRKSIPKSLKTDADSDFYSISFPVFSTSNRVFNLELFGTETKQDPVTIDCYQFGTTVIGGSCEEADIQLLDSKLYRSTGEMAYIPVLKTQGISDGYGINLRINSNVDKNLKISHTLTLGEEEIYMSFESAILNTTDSFLRGARINGTTTGELLDSFKNDLPQETPWKERYFKYSINSTYGLSENLALSGRFSLIKVSRSNYEKNPLKEDFTDNQVLDLGFFYRPLDNLLIYSRLSLTTSYLLGITPIAYNRKSNHLFDHPYGQLYIGTLISF
tara:strand:+ start:313 stop:1428 length:1116 start_codon:yes stop_codon:yes gene_type:complete